MKISLHIKILVLVGLTQFFSNAFARGYGQPKPKESYPSQISCFLSFEKPSESFSCNDFTVNSDSEKDLVTKLCEFAAGDLYEVIVEDGTCEKELASSVCTVENEIMGTKVPTYYFLVSRSDRALAVKNCEKMGGVYSDIM